MSCDIYRELEELENCKPLTKCDITESDWLPAAMCQCKTDNSDLCHLHKSPNISVLLPNSFQVGAGKEDISRTQLIATSNGVRHNFLNNLPWKEQITHDIIDVRTDVAVNDVSCPTGLRFQRLISWTDDNIRLLLSTKAINEISSLDTSTSLSGFNGELNGNDSRRTPCFRDTSGEFGVSQSFSVSSTDTNVSKYSFSESYNKIIYENKKNDTKNMNMKVTSVSNDIKNNKIKSVNVKTDSHFLLSSVVLPPNVLSKENNTVVTNTNSKNIINAGNKKAELQPTTFNQSCDRICNVLGLSEIEVSTTSSPFPSCGANNEQNYVFTGEKKEIQSSGGGVVALPSSSSTSAVVIVGVYEVSSGQSPATSYQMINNTPSLQGNIIHHLIPEKIISSETQNKAGDVLSSDLALPSVSENDKKKEKCVIDKHTEQKVNVQKDNGLIANFPVLCENVNENSCVRGEKESYEMNFISVVNNHNGAKENSVTSISSASYAEKQMKNRSLQNKELTVFSSGNNVSVWCHRSFGSKNAKVNAGKKCCSVI